MVPLQLAASPVFSARREIDILLPIDGGRAPFPLRGLNALEPVTQVQPHLDLQKY